jgi:hypothetical protein
MPEVEYCCKRISQGSAQLSSKRAMNQEKMNGPKTLQGDLEMIKLIPEGRKILQGERKETSRIIYVLN